MIALAIALYLTGAVWTAMLMYEDGPDWVHLLGVAILWPIVPPAILLVAVITTVVVWIGNAWKRWRPGKETDDV